MTLKSVVGKEGAHSLVQEKHPFVKAASAGYLLQLADGLAKSVQTNCSDIGLEPDCEMVQRLSVAIQNVIAAIEKTPRPGQAAYPCDAGNEWDGERFTQRPFQPGVDLRTWLASRIVQGMIAGMGFDAPIGPIDGEGASPVPRYLRVAYEFADAMIAERDRKQSEAE